jgi:hypothetical protein
MVLGGGVRCALLHSHAKPPLHFARRCYATLIGMRGCNTSPFRLNLTHRNLNSENPLPPVVKIHRGGLSPCFFLIFPFFFGLIEAKRRINPLLVI